MANRLDARTVVLTDAEMVVKEWVDALLDEGLGVQAAIDKIEMSVPRHGKTWTALRDRVFFEYLTL